MSGNSKPTQNDALSFEQWLDRAKAITEKLTSDETILRALNAEEPRAATDNLADWGEQSIARMRRALTAAIGGDDEG